MDCGRAGETGRVWYADSLKWDGRRELGVVRAFLGHEARRKNIAFAWNLLTIQPQAAYCMPIQRTYRRVTEDPFTAHHTDCGMYLFLMVVLLRADESLGMLLPEHVNRERPVLAWSLLLHPNPIAISHWVRRNPVRRPVVTALVADIVSPNPTIDTQYMTRQRGTQASDILTNSNFIPSRQPVKFETLDTAELYTYAATSSLPGAGRGLFARRLIGPDSPLDDGEYVGEYIGGEN